LRFETGLPGLKTWGVTDWRLGQLRGRPNVNMYPGSALGVGDILRLEHRHVVIATGARWTKMLFSTLEFGLRVPRDDLYQALVAEGSGLEKAGIAAVTRIGDALAPGAIVHAVHSGHRHAREFDTVPGAAPYTRDFPVGHPPTP
jgi:hypothetical protein